MNAVLTTDKMTLRSMARRPDWLPERGSIEAHFLSEVAAKVREVCAFIIPRRGVCFPEATWQPRKLFRYVTWHLLQQNLFLVRRDGELKGVAFAWPAIARDVQQRAALDEPQFAWKPPVKNGDCVFIAQVVGTRMNGREWLERAQERWPNLALARIYTYRRGALVEITYEVLRRFCA